MMHMTYASYSLGLYFYIVDFISRWMCTVYTYDLEYFVGNFWVSTLILFR